MLRTRNNTVETLFSWSYINKSQAHKPPGAITCALACGYLAKPGYHSAKVVITRVSYVHEYVPYLGWLSLVWGHCSSLGMVLWLCQQHLYTASCGRAAGWRGSSLLLIVEVVCLVPALTPYHHLRRQSRYVPCVLDSLSFHLLHRLWPHCSLGAIAAKCRMLMQRGFCSVLSMPRGSC